MIKHSRHTASVPQQRSRWLLGGGDALLLTPATDHTHTKPPPTLFLALSRALRCLGAKGTAMSFRSVNDSANGSTEKVTVLFDFGLAVEEPHIDEKLSAMRASLRSVRRRICSERSA